LNPVPVVGRWKDHVYDWSRARVDMNGLMLGEPCLKVPHWHKDDPKEDPEDWPVSRIFAPRGLRGCVPELVDGVWCWVRPTEKQP
jgi:hypothetical protein